MSDHVYMNAALALARRASDNGEIPVGCVIVRNGKIIAEGENTRERTRSALGHAELNAIAAACVVAGDWRLDDCDLFVTLEPCPMCAGAILNARIARVVYAATDMQTGAMGGAADIMREKWPYRPEVFAGFMAEESSLLLAEFFRKVRDKKVVDKAE